MSLGLLVPSVSPAEMSGDFDISEVVGAISSSPFMGEKTIPISDVNGQIYLQWGLGSGLYLLLFSGIILIISGIMEIIANTSFFESKIDKIRVKKDGDKSGDLAKESKSDEHTSEEDTE